MHECGRSRILCLPDQAAVEAVELIDNPNTKVIDASTAHRCSLHWAYGFSELGEGFLEKIKTGKRVANPGCHATGSYQLLIRCVSLASFMRMM